MESADFAGASAGLRGVVCAPAGRPTERDEPVTGARTERRAKEKWAKTHYQLCKVGIIRKGVPGSGSTVFLMVRGDRKGRAEIHFTRNSRVVFRNWTLLASERNTLV